MAPKIRKFVAKIDMLLKFEMHHRGQNTPGKGHPRVRKTPDLPDLRSFHVTRRAVSVSSILIISNTVWGLFGDTLFGVSHA